MDTDTAHLQCGRPKWNSPFSAASDADGVIDEVRITGNVEYSGDFTPPQRPYTFPSPPPPSGVVFRFR